MYQPQDITDFMNHLLLQSYYLDLLLPVFEDPQLCLLVEEIKDTTSIDFKEARVYSEIFLHVGRRTIQGKHISS